MTIHVDFDQARRHHVIRIELHIPDEVIEDTVGREFVYRLENNRASLPERLRFLADMLERLNPGRQRDPGDENDYQRRAARLSLANTPGTPGSEPAPERPNALRPNRKLDL